MNKHVTIEFDEDELARARIAAEARGLAMEDYLKRLVAAHLPSDTPESQQKALLAKIIGMGSSEQPTNIAKDKGKFMGEAVWQEYLRETKQSAE